MRLQRSGFLPRPERAVALLALMGALLAHPFPALGALEEAGQPQKEPLWADPAPPTTSPEAASLEKAFTDVAERVGPAVVSVEASYTVVQQFSPWGGDEFFDDFFRRFFDAPPGGYERRHPVRSLGSGVIVSRDGYVLTNAHVIGEASNVTVRLLNKKEYKAKIIGKDEGTDLAVLKISPEGEITAAPLGDSDRIKVGQWSIAIGNPFALENTVTVGVISAKGRQLDSKAGGAAARYTSFIQTDASINKGNSGGPLLNLKGEVIGINSMIFSSSGGSIGIGFAIPSNTAKSILAGILKSGRFIRPQLGIMFGPLKPEVAKKMGLTPGTGMEVTNVSKGSAADGAGIRPSDIILAVDGKPLRQVEDLRSAILAHQVGDQVPLEIFRGGKKTTVTVTLKEESRPSSTPAVKAKPKKGGGKAEIRWMGMTVIDLTDAIARELQTDNSSGVVISGVTPGSPAEAASLARGDIIREIEQKPVSGIADFRSAMKRYGSRKPVLVLVERQGSSYHTVIDPNGGGQDE